MTSCDAPMLESVSSFSVLFDISGSKTVKYNHKVLAGPGTCVSDDEVFATILNESIIPA